jgi:hypothetical protein
MPNPQSSRSGQTPRLALLAAATLLLALAVLLLGSTRQPAQAVPNLPPEVFVDKPSVVVYEGQTATNIGTFEDPEDDGVFDSVNISASEGAITKTGKSVGTWSWSLATKDVPTDETRTVTITATDSGGLSDRVSFSLTVKNGPPPPPANDNFANAQSIGGSAASVSGTTKSATRETGEPDHYTSNPADADWWRGEHTVWYSWKAPDSGPTNIDTCQANIDSILAVYTGTDLSNLSRVVDNNNDRCGGGWGSRVTFIAQGGTTYRIAVGDAGGLQENTFTLKLSGPATQAPRVFSTDPAAGATGVDPAANVTATFSEAMDASTINDTTFKLAPAGTGNVITATVRYDPTTKKAILDPSANLRLGTKYHASISTAATDLAGNRLDQNGNMLGLQGHQWTFTVRN